MMWSVNGRYVQYLLQLLYLSGGLEERGVANVNRCFLVSNAKIGKSFECQVDIFARPWTHKVDTIFLWTATITHRKWFRYRDTFGTIPIAEIVVILWIATVLLILASWNRSNTKLITWLIIIITMMVLTENLHWYLLKLCNTIFRSIIIPVKL